MSKDEAASNKSDLVEEPNRKITFVLSVIVLTANFLVAIVLVLDRLSPAAHQVLKGWLNYTSDIWLNTFS